MDYEISMSDYDVTTNSVMATMTTRLTEAEEANWRRMLAEAWEQGCEAGMSMAAESFWRPENPYRDKE